MRTTSRLTNTRQVTSLGPSWIIGVALAFAFALAPTKARAQGGLWDEVEFETLDKIATTVLNQAQVLSFQNNREYCGFIAFDTEQKLRATRPLAGEKDSCLPDIPNNWEMLASYHTHGATDVDDLEASFEVPSSDDLLSDMEQGVDGYVATPGGRFWFVDGLDGLIKLIGGPGTLTSDPNYVPNVGCEIQQLTLDELQAFDDGSLDPCDN